jgi:polysaccharide biosynthesis transport protein
MTNNGTPIIFYQGSDSILLEPYRLLRTHIKSSQGLKPLKTVLITSSAPGEGKSTVASNLGYTLAQDGASVLLVDTDLRSPTLHEIFRIANGFGLTDAVTKIYNKNITSGVLGKQGLGDILQFIKFQERTGLLRVEDGEQIFRLTFERGKIADAVWENRPIERRTGSVLVKAGKITEKQLEEALQRQDKTSHALGYILTRSGYIGTHDLESVLRFHVSESLNEALELKEASFAFHESVSPKSKRSGLNSPESQALLLKGTEILVESDQPFIEEEIDSLIRETRIKNLKLMPSGSSTSHASELLSSERMKSVVKILSNRFDFILFDSPPVAATADASILASFLDGVILVVQAGRLGIRDIQQTKDELSKVRANMMGVVFNQFDTKKEGYYADYYGYYAKDRV